MKNIAGLVVSFMFFWIAYDIYATGIYIPYFVYPVELGAFKNLAASLFVAIGGVVLYKYYIYFKTGISQKDEIEYSKCPRCKKSYSYFELEKGICPTCKVETIDMEIYFDKYPEDLKDVP